MNTFFRPAFMKSESYNILSWKGPSRITESSFWLHTRSSKKLAIFLRMLFRCSAQCYDHSPGKSFQCHRTLSVKNHSWYPTWLLPVATFYHSLGSYHCHQREEISSCPSASPCEEVVKRDEIYPQFPPGWTNQDISATPNMSSFLDPSPSL